MSQPPATGVGETILGEEGNAVDGALATVFAHIVTDPNAQRSFPVSRVRSAGRQQFIAMAPDGDMTGASDPQRAGGSTAASRR